jgi:hypothetical protein
MKCDICNKEIVAKQGTWNRQYWQINAAVSGDYMELKGHKICCENVNQLVVIPNRFRLMRNKKIIKAIFSE